MKDIEHLDFIELVKAFHPVPFAGLCYGFMSMGAQARLTDEYEIQHFKNRLAWLSENILTGEPNLQARIAHLKHTIENIHESQKKKEGQVRLPLTEAEKQMLDIESFLQMLALKHTPETFKLSPNYVRQDADSVNAWVTSDVLEAKGKAIHSTWIGLGTPTQKELTNYLLSMQGMFKSTSPQEPEYVFVLSSMDHWIEIDFDETTQMWNSLDINDLQAKKKYFFKGSSEKLSKRIMEAFEDNKNTAFSIQLRTTRQDPDKELAFKALSEKCLGPTAMRVQSKGVLSFLKNAPTRSQYEESTNDRGVSALMIAAFEGITPKVKELISLGANVNAVNHSSGSPGRTILMGAAENGHLEVVNLLLEKGAQIEAKNAKGNTALMIASELGQNAVVQRLLEQGAKVNKTNNTGFTPFMKAALFGRAQTMAILIKGGAQINTPTSNGTTPLMLAAEQGHTESVSLLIQSGANLTAKDEYQYTAIMVAAANPSSVGALRVLISAYLEKGLSLEHELNSSEGPKVRKVMNELLQLAPKPLEPLSFHTTSVESPSLEVKGAEPSSSFKPKK